MFATRVTGTTPLTAMERELLAVASLVRTYTVTISTLSGSSRGSGVVWRHDGLVITSAHVARDPRMVVSTFNGQEVEGRVLARDEEKDLALLQISAGGLLIAPPGDAWSLRPGSLVLAAGGNDDPLAPLSLGVVKSVSRGAEGEPRWIAADIRIGGADVGGPLVDASARVLGINGASVNGLGAAVPVNVVQRFIREAEQTGLIRDRAALAA